MARLGGGEGNYPSGLCDEILIKHVKTFEHWV